MMRSNVLLTLFKIRVLTKIHRCKTTNKKCLPEVCWPFWEFSKGEVVSVCDEAGFVTFLGGTSRASVTWRSCILPNNPERISISSGYGRRGSPSRTKLKITNWKTLHAYRRGLFQEKHAKYSDIFLINCQIVEKLKSFSFYAPMKDMSSET